MTEQGVWDKINRLTIIAQSVFQLKEHQIILPGISSILYRDKL